MRLLTSGTCKCGEKLYAVEIVEIIGCFYVPFYSLRCLKLKHWWQKRKHTPVKAISQSDFRNFAYDPAL
jgi:hypothetical protein